jgi:hypothetical protein
MPRTIADILGCASPTNTREPDDFYATPPECTEALIAAEGDRLPLRVWDPCCGAGDISTVLQRHGREVVSTDLIDRGYGQGRVDFLSQRNALARAIVTNPPFNRADAFLRHAAEMRLEYVAFLHKADWLNAAERGSLIEKRVVSGTVLSPAVASRLQESRRTDDELQLVRLRTRIDARTQLGLRHSMETDSSAAPAAQRGQ